MLLGPGTGITFSLPAQFPHQRKTRIADQRCTGIRHQRQRLPFLQACDHLFQAHPFVVLMQGKHRRIDAEMRKQLTGMPGILGGNALHFPQDAQGTRADILQIADGVAITYSAPDSTVMRSLHPAPQTPGTL